ncbi:hypothetical protein FRC08_015698 [Ceratobasidium sp. 394]|nr:hypothetical protein FRC08_015698 [Ceratobasidium sp. 394]
MMGFKNGIVVAAVVAGVSAQGWMQGQGSLSSSCQTALAGALTGPAGQCLGVPGLANIAATKGDESLIPPIDSWLNTTCAQPACTNATIDAVVGNVTSGCRSDLNQWHVTDEDIETVSGYIKEFYPPAREVACLKDSNASNQFCITESLKKFENSTGMSLTPNNLWNLSPSLYSTNSTLTKELTCTDCTKAAWNIIKPYLGSDAQAEVASQLDQICGAGFSNSPAPPSVQRTANSAVQAANNNSQNGAVSTSAFSSMIAAVLGVAGVFALVL